MKTIPDYIVNEDVRKYLNELNGHMDTLENAFRDYSAQKKHRTLTPEEEDMVRQIREAYDNLHKVFTELTPSIRELIQKHLLLHR